jgi:GMC oxidoreductase
MATAWTGDSIFFAAAGRLGIRVWRQRVSPTTFTPDGPPELMTPGGESAYFPTVSCQRLGFVGVHTDTNMWSVGIDPGTGKAEGVPRRLTRGAGFVSHFSVSRDGKMGRDSMSVVDANLQVYGITNLRIADGSIMPRVTTGNTMAPCIVISERAGEILRAAYRI